MSEQTLDALIAKVKMEAIETAKREAQKIHEAAEQKAKKIVTEAHNEKVQILQEAKKESDALKEKGQIALIQAARDVKIAVKNDLIKLFDATLKAEVSEAFTNDLYSQIILQLATKLEENYALVLPAETKEEVLRDLKRKVSQSQIGKQIITSHKLFTGLSVKNIEEGWSYDITDDEVSDLIMSQLGEKWETLLKL